MSRDIFCCKLSGEQLHLSNNSSGEDTSIYERQHFVNQMFNGYPDIQYLADDFCRCKSNSSRFSNVVNNSGDLQ